MRRYWELEIRQRERRQEDRKRDGGTAVKLYETTYRKNRYEEGITRRKHRINQKERMRQKKSLRWCNRLRPVPPWRSSEKLPRLKEILKRRNSWRRLVSKRGLGFRSWISVCARET